MSLQKKPGDLEGMSMRRAIKMAKELCHRVEFSNAEYKIQAVSGGPWMRVSVHRKDAPRSLTNILNVLTGRRPANRCFGMQTHLVKGKGPR